MATVPKITTLTSTSVDILNVIRNNSTQNYRDYVPKATPDADSIREIGAVIMDYPALQNEFLSALVNRIGRVMITSKMYENPWAMFKKGLLEFGETVEEIFVNMAKPFQFDPAVAESNLFKREIPDVRSAFHIMNYQKYYKSTVSNDQLRQAFLSWQGITDLIAKIVDAMYTGAEYDEFITMKYMLARHILDGRMYPITIPTVETANMKQIVSKIKGVSNQYEFQSNKYNVAGVYTHTKKNEQYLLINSVFDAEMDVEVLASAFNMNKAEFMGQRVLVDSFGSLDIDRLRVLFANDSTYKEPTSAELTALDEIPCVLVDKDWFMIFDNFYNFTEQYNGEGLYWNYWYHTWKTFSASPFANNALFIPGTPAVTAVSVTPSTATVNKGQNIQLNATVTTTAFAPKTVKWTSSAPDVTVDNSGKVTVPADASSTSVTITATSTYDGTKKGTATLTIA
jgi:Bacterial surface proteins containing Ig-like domains